MNLNIHSPESSLGAQNLPIRGFGSSTSVPDVESGTLQMPPSSFEATSFRHIHTLMCKCTSRSSVLV